MKSTLTLRWRAPLLSALASLMLLSGLLANPGPANIAKAASSTLHVSQPTQLTTGNNYDRNPTFLKAADGTYWLFFARSLAAPCSRNAGAVCPSVDNTTFNIFYMTSNNGTTWSSPIQLSDRSGLDGTFYGRTIAATQDVDGKIWVFWASGGSSNGVYFYTYQDGTWSGRNDLNGPSDNLHPFFNVEAVAKDRKIWLFYEDAGGVAPFGSYVENYDLDSLVWSSPVLFAAGKSIPKAIVDNSGFKVVTVDGNTGEVFISTSTDGQTWSDPSSVVAPNGTTTNWDPTIFKDAAGKYNIFYAPDLGDGSGAQRVAWKQSADGVNWSAAGSQVTAAKYGANTWWDFWPEAGQVGPDTVLFYTSEKNGTALGSAHIMMSKVYWPQGENHFEAIAPALEAAAAGDTVKVAAGTYSEAGLTITKPLTLTGAGKGNTVIAGSGSGNGISLGAGVGGINISKLSVTGFENGIKTLGNVNTSVANILLEDVEASDNAIRGVFFEDGVVSNVTFRRVDASRNNQGGGNGGRGIWIVNGVKSNIKVESGTFNNNGLVGIDISDGSVMGLQITGNIVTGNGDSGIAVQGAQGPNPNLIGANIVTNNGRFGIELKNSLGNGQASGNGSLTIAGNFVSRNIPAIDKRDYAGIAVVRRDPSNPDFQPSGTAVINNAVTGYHSNAPGSTGDGFGIVVEGLNNLVNFNVVNNNDVGIQVQGGNTANTQSTPFFDRGNAAAGSATVNRNSIAGNGFGVRSVGNVNPVDGTCNWWGSAQGPTNGDQVSSNITYKPWLKNSNILTSPCNGGGKD